MRRGEQHKIPSRPSQASSSWPVEVWHKQSQICKQKLVSRIRQHSSGLSKHWRGHQNKLQTRLPTAQQEIPGSMVMLIQLSRNKKFETRSNLRYKRRHIVGCSLNQRRSGTNFLNNLVCFGVKVLPHTYPDYIFYYIAMRKKLRPGDHYNILLDFPGFPIYIQIKLFTDSFHFRFRCTPGLTSGNPPYSFPWSGQVCLVPNN